MKLLIKPKGKLRERLSSRHVAKAKDQGDFCLPVAIRRATSKTTSRKIKLVQPG